MYRMEDAVRLEQRLQSHLDALHRYMTAVNIQIQAQSADKADKKLDRVSRTLNEVYTLVKVQENRPKVLGYPWEAALASHVKFEDALGRNVMLPDILCRSALSFRDVVQIMFANHPGFEMIVRGDYEIIDADTNLVILRGASNSSNSNLETKALQTRWRHHVLPGTKLAMNIINKRRLGSPDFLLPAVPKEVPCPNCGWQNSGCGLRKW